MTWTKLSDDFSDDCWSLSDGAFRLHVEAHVWSNRKLLDCVIPKDDLRRFAHDESHAPELLAVGWWSDTGTTYTIRHHASYQRTREQVVKRQQTSAVNGAKGGRPPTREIAENLANNPLGNPLDNPQGQDGTGQAGTTGPPTKVDSDHEIKATTNNIGRCRGCGGREPLIEDGKCRDCLDLAA